MKATTDRDFILGVMGTACAVACVTCVVGQLVRDIDSGIWAVVFVLGYLIMLLISLTRLYLAHIVSLWDNIAPTFYFHLPATAGAAAIVSSAYYLVRSQGTDLPLMLVVALSLVVVAALVQLREMWMDLKSLRSLSMEYTE